MDETTPDPWKDAPCAASSRPPSSRPASWSCTPCLPWLGTSTATARGEYSLFRLLTFRYTDGGGEVEDAAAPIRHGGDGGRRKGASADRLVARIRRGSVPLSVLGLVLALAVCWAIALTSGSPTSVGRHAFYVPIVLGAARFGFRGAVATGAVAMLLAGPLVPGGVPPGVWMTRGAFLVGVGTIVAALTTVGERTAFREAELARDERRLHDQRTALIQTISHEFRTPLTIIHGVAETLVQREELLAEPLRPLAPALHRAERRLSNMVGAVLAASDELGDEVEQEIVEVTPLLREIAEELDNGAAERVRVSVAPGSGRLVTSRTHARLLLRCLVDNAIRFSGPDDPVDVRVETGEERTTIAIRDRGEGIDPGFVGRAFEPFTQADSSTVRQHGGLGLGLYTARHLARRLGGEVDVRPAEEGGSLAVVRLPQRREADRTGVSRTSS